MTQSWEEQYINLLSAIYERGEDRADRTGTGTRALFGQHLDIPLWKGFPLTTTKKTSFKMIKSELLWFLEGSTDERRLAEIHYGNRDSQNSTIWTANAQADYWKPKAAFDGDLGKVYGAQWRGWTRHTTVHTEAGGLEHCVTDPIDQIATVIDKIKNNHTDRRMVVSAWNVGELDNMALPPCHMFFQVFVTKNKLLSLQMYQRSVDSALGLPFNIASYALLAHMLAHVTGCTVDRLILCLGDTHIYQDHLSQIPSQIKREPKKPPALWLNPDVKNIDDFTMDDIRLDGYESHPAIKFDMAV